MEADAYVEVVTNDADRTAYSGFVLRVSPGFVLLQPVDDWAIDGVRIFPLSRLAEVNHDELMKDRQAIIDWTGVDRSARFDWVDLSSFPALFESARLRDQTLVVEDDDEVEVGVVRSVGERSVSLRLIDGAGAWLEEPLDFPFDEILVVDLGDRYSTVLRGFADRNQPRG